MKMILSAKFLEVINKINFIREGTRFVLSNLFEDASSLHEIFDKKSCFYYSHENSLILLNQYHKKYYNILFLTKDVFSLKKSLRILLSSYKGNYILRVSLIGKQSLVEELSTVFVDCGFILQKKVVRTRINEKESSECVSDSMLTCDEIHSEYDIGFADVGDEKEIFSLLMEEFDCSADNIPELDDI